MSWDGMDRRKHKRVSLRLLLEFDDPNAPEGERTTRLETLNFSAGGFYCLLNRQVTPLTRLGLRFIFPAFGPNHEEEREVNCEAVVVRSEPEANTSGTHRIAACFTSLAPADREFIEEYMDWYDTVYNEGDEFAEPETEPDEDEQVA